jgi:Mg-chelatase subunit ChlD
MAELSRLMQKKLTVLVLAVMVMLSSLLAGVVPPVSFGSADTEITGLDVVLVIDTSGSMDNRDATDLQGNTVSRLYAAKQAALAFVAYLGPDDRIGVASFSHKGDQQIYHLLTDPTAEANDAINSLPRIGPGKTGIGYGIKKAIDELGSIDQRDPNHAQLMVIMTDGYESEHVDETDPKHPLWKAQEAVDAGYYVYCLGFGAEPNMDLLQSMAEYSKSEKGLGRAFRELTTDDIRSIYAEVKGGILNIPEITVIRIVQRISGTNAYDVTLVIENAGGETAENVHIYEDLWNFQYAGSPSPVQDFSVYTYLMPAYDWLIRLDFDVGSLAPGDEKTYNYKVVTVLDGHLYWEPSEGYKGYTSHSPTYRSWFGDTKVIYDGISQPESKNAPIDIVDGEPLGRVDPSTDMLILSSPDALLSKYGTEEAYRILGAMASTAMEQNAILGFLDFPSYGDWVAGEHNTLVKNKIAEWIIHELEFWDINDASEYYLMIVGGHDIIPMYWADEPDPAGETEHVPTDQFYADLNDDFLPDLAIGRVTALNPYTMVLLVRTKERNSGTNVIYLYNSGFAHTGETADLFLFDWFLTANPEIHSCSSPLYEADLQFKAIIWYDGHGHPYRWGDLAPNFQESQENSAKSGELDGIELPIIQGSVVLADSCLTANIMRGTLDETVDPEILIDVMGKEWAAAHPDLVRLEVGKFNLSKSIALNFIKQGAYVYFGATRRVCVLGYELFHRIVNNIVNGKMTIGMAVKEAKRWHFYHTSLSRNKVKHQLLAYNLIGNPKFILNPIPGDPPGPVQMDNTAKTLDNKHDKPVYTLSLDFVPTLQKAPSGKDIVSTNGSILRRNSGYPVTAVAPRKILLPSGSAVQSITATGTFQTIGTYDIEVAGTPEIITPNGTIPSEPVPLKVYGKYPPTLINASITRETGGAVTLLLDIYPLHWNTLTKEVTFYNHIDITIKYTTDRTAELPYLRTDRSSVPRDEEVTFYWQAKNKLSSPQDLTAKFHVMDTAGGIVTEFDETQTIGGRTTKVFKNHWTANVDPAIYLVRLDLLDKDSVLVDSKTVSITVLEEPTFDMTLLDSSEEEISAALLLNGWPTGVREAYMVGGTGSITVAYALAPWVARSDTPIVVTDNSLLSIVIQNALPVVGVRTVTLVQVDDEIDAAITQTLRSYTTNQYPFRYYTINEIKDGSAIDLAATLATTKWETSPEVVITLAKYPLAMLASEYAAYNGLPLLYISEAEVPPHCDHRSRKPRRTEHHSDIRRHHNQRRSFSFTSLCFK